MCDSRFSKGDVIDSRGKKIQKSDFDLACILKVPFQVKLPKTFFSRIILVAWIEGISEHYD